MGHQIVEMPNGNLAIWSTVVDDWIMTDATDREVIDYERMNGASLDRVELAVERARGRIEPIHYGGYPPETFEHLDNWRRLMHERVQCAKCGHDEITHDGGEGPCDYQYATADPRCGCEPFEAPTANANASVSAASMTPEDTQ